MRNQLATAACRRPERVARQRSPQHVRIGRTGTPDRQRAARHDQQSDDLREGDRRRQRLRRAASQPDRLRKSADALFWDLAIQDIQSACDEFKVVFDSSGGNDGFVSLEVSPLLAHDTQGTIAMAKELWARVARPNLMVKIPGTKEGVPGDRRVHIRRPQHQRDADLLDRHVRKGRARVRARPAAPRRREQTGRQDPLGQLGLRQPHRYGGRRDHQRPHRQRRETRRAARQSRRRRPEDDLSEVQRRSS